jgi:hypothetical protein
MTLQCGHGSLLVHGHIVAVRCSRVSTTNSSCAESADDASSCAAIEAVDRPGRRAHGGLTAGDPSQSQGTIFWRAPRYRAKDASCSSANSCTISLPSRAACFRRLFAERRSGDEAIDVNNPSRRAQLFCPLPSDLAKSIGRGKTMVELFSPAILSRVPR